MTARTDTSPTTGADPITTEVIRHGLNSAADQMKRALVRTAFSPIVYEVLDFAVAIYDRQFRLMAQAPTLPLFMGTMNFCVEGAVAAVGGESAVDAGDVILFNSPYETGSHAQDVAAVMPIHLSSGELLGYAATKVHWTDIAGKDPHSSDTVDVFQEGLLLPGVKLYRQGVRQDEIQRLVVANTRMPAAIRGDLAAQVVGLRTGVEAVQRIADTHGIETFRACLERIFDHGEAVIRRYLEQIPDGRYSARGTLDNDGIHDEKIPFEIAIEIVGSTVVLDFTAAPDALPGPLNCPRPSTISASRVAISMLAGGGESPNEGHFRATEVNTRPGSMFEPLSPSPCNFYHIPASQAIEVIYHAIAEITPDAVPACSGGDFCPLVMWGVRGATREPWAYGAPHPIGHGAHWRGDGGSAMIHIGESAARTSPVEVIETKAPLVVQHLELAIDSGGTGRFRGGLGVNFAISVEAGAVATIGLERTKTAPWGLEGGGAGRANLAVVSVPGADARNVGKATRVNLPKGTVVELRTGGGGGFGPPSERDPEAVWSDVLEGYVTEAQARRDYPHAFGLVDPTSSRRST